jgi:predicted metal-dependent hydrolase
MTVTSKYWCDNSPVWTHYGNASSVLFPAWEKAFAAVVTHYLPQVKDEELRQRMVQFIKEELSHANAHEAFNARHGLKELEEKEYRQTRIVYKRPNLPFWLGTMVSIEHLAACMSRSVLGRWKNNPNRDYKLFCWHAIEELGHKSLAIDLWNYLGFSEKELKKIAKTNQKYVMGFLIGYTIKNVYKDGQLKKLSTWKELLSWSYFVTSKVLIPMLTIYLPKFHPNNTNDEQYLQAAV